MAVVYHSTSSGAPEIYELYNHIQCNADTFLRDHPDALILVTGDFNPTSTGFDEKHVKGLSDLSQIVDGYEGELHTRLVFKSDFL